MRAGSALCARSEYRRPLDGWVRGRVRTRRSPTSSSVSRKGADGLSRRRTARGGLARAGVVRGSAGSRLRRGNGGDAGRRGIPARPHTHPAAPTHPGGSSGVRSVGLAAMRLVPATTPAAAVVAATLLIHRRAGVEEFRRCMTTPICRLLVGHLVFVVAGRADRFWAVKIRRCLLDDTHRLQVDSSARGILPRVERRVWSACAPRWRARRRQARWTGVARGTARSEKPRSRPARSVASAFFRAADRPEGDTGDPGRRRAVLGARPGGGARLLPEDAWQGGPGRPAASSPSSWPGAPAGRCSSRPTTARPPTTSCAREGWGVQRPADQAALRHRHVVPRSVRQQHPAHAGARVLAGPDLSGPAR